MIWINYSRKRKPAIIKICLFKITRIQTERGILLDKQSKTTTVNKLIVNDKSITEPEPIANDWTHTLVILVLIWLTAK